MRVSIMGRKIAALETGKLRLLVVLPLWLLATSTLHAALLDEGFETGNITDGKTNYSAFNSGFIDANQAPYNGKEPVTISLSGVTPSQQHPDWLELRWIPEPATFIAGALLTIPFGLQTIRVLRKRKKAV